MSRSVGTPLAMSCCSRTDGRSATGEQWTRWGERAPERPPLPFASRGLISECDTRGEHEAMSRLLRRIAGNEPATHERRGEPRGDSPPPPPPPPPLPSASPPASLPSFETRRQAVPPAGTRRLVLPAAAPPMPLPPLSTLMRVARVTCPLFTVRVEGWEAVKGWEAVRGWAASSSTASGTRGER